MAYRVNWSPRALTDVEDIAHFIEKDSLFYAQAVVTKIVRSTAKLADFPLVGRIFPNSDSRIFASSSYTAIG